MKKATEILKEKWLKQTSLTLVLVLIIIALYVEVNVLVNKLNIPDLDLTKSKIYSLSDETKTKIENIQKDVKIILINMDNYEYVGDYANKYHELNNKINVEKISNLSGRTDLIEKYKLDSSTNSIIVESDQKDKILSVDDLYTYEFTGSNYEEVNKTEEALTNAILDVTTDVKPQIYLYNKHSSYSDKFFKTLKESIENDANDALNLDLLSSGKVPDDCNCLVIPTLTEDISEVEKNYIINYINNGGNILLLQDPNILKIQTPNFNQILDLYGFNISDGVVMEQDDEKMIYDMPGFVISDIDENTSLTKNLNMNIKMCLMDPGEIKFKDEDTLEKLGVSYEIIAKASEKAFIRNDLNISDKTKTENDQDAQNAILSSLITKKINDEETSKLIVYSNAIFSTDTAISIKNTQMSAISFYNNKDMVVNSVNYLAEKENSIIIRKKYGDQVKFTVTDADKKRINCIIYGVPILILIIGFVVWIIRKNKK